MNDFSENKALLTAWIAACNERNLEAVGAMLADDFVNHGALPGAQSKDGMPRLLSILWKGMPDMKWKLEDVVAEGDRVVGRVTMTGTQTGPLEFKAGTVPATGREVVSEQIHIFRVAGGKLAETWIGRDDLGMFRQLGIAFGPSRA
jgi:steroid delta-isomerase-like uncharacterized protein